MILNKLTFPQPRLSVFSDPFRTVNDQRPFLIRDELQNKITMYQFQGWNLNIICIRWEGRCLAWEGGKSVDKVSRRSGNFCFAESNEFSMYLTSIFHN